MTRRRLIASLGAFWLIPQLAGADEYIDLDWNDLVPN